MLNEGTSQGFVAGTGTDNLETPPTSLRDPIDRVCCADDEHAVRDRRRCQARLIHRVGGEQFVCCSRTNNEDVFYICEECHFCLVADGMGGAAAGEVASRIFAETAKAVFAGHDGSSEENTIARVQTTFRLANDKIDK